MQKIQLGTNKKVIGTALNYPLFFFFFPPLTFLGNFQLEMSEKTWISFNS